LSVVAIQPTTLSRWQRQSCQNNRLRDTSIVQNYHRLLRTSMTVPCVRSSCIVRVPCMTTLSVLGNVRRVVADLVRPRSQSQLSSGYLTDVGIGVVVAVAACVMFCILQHWHSKTLFACGMSVKWQTLDDGRLCDTAYASNPYWSLRRCVVELQGVSRVVVASAVVASRVAACPL
jgi:hypothetical protein